MEQKALRTNEDKVVMQSVGGKVHHPIVKGVITRTGSYGEGHVLPAHGGITYNFQIGDCCMGLAGDHIEPGVSSFNADPLENVSYNNLSCVGNVATVMTGDAKGEKGYVTGKHGGIEHVMIWFPQETLEKLNVDDRILVRAYGLGMELLDYPQVKLMNLDPRLLDAMDIEVKDGKLVVPVAAVVPSFLMGSGLGKGTMTNGDYDIMTRDTEMIKKCHLDTLKFGDVVLIEDHVCEWGPDYYTGARTIGVIIHSDSFKAGHGPGVTVLMTSRESIIEPKLDPNANLKELFAKMKK